MKSLNDVLVCTLNCAGLQPIDSKNKFSAKNIEKYGNGTYIRPNLICSFDRYKWISLYIT